MRDPEFEADDEPSTSGVVDKRRAVLLRGE
jgi:hypothetical protein